MVSATAVVFIVGLFKFSICKSALSATSSVVENHMTFYRNRLIQGTNGHSMSLLNCAAHCQSASSINCTSYLYRRSTGQCLLASRPYHLDTYFRAGEGDLYAGCNTGKGYKVYTLGNTRACLLLYQQMETYNQAVATCGMDEGFVASTETLEKLDLVSSFLSPTIEDLWVGWTGAQQEEADDMEEEDGFMLNLMQGYAHYIPGGPGEDGGGCNIVSTKTASRTLTGVSCSTFSYCLCEMMIKIM
ncbi:hypothetical protein PoB_001109900 [Plakobranchus ocellatus]|uniref:Apple domain-containing protein n=1 Tax=Plakobranchus ocellatus TaxID=259542 RepID=A0AAV3YRJ6_9GAST|nr:hypothetical protein PoB_001109900 [Plakobranchus ocellatus]